MATRSYNGWLIVALVALGLRALTPLGYMPASPGTGLLYELCPDGMPAEVMQAFTGGGHSHHHHHTTDNATSNASESCPLGHMLASAVAVDIEVTGTIEAGSEAFLLPTGRAVRAQAAARYQSRAPPA